MLMGNLLSTLIIIIYSQSVYSRGTKSVVSRRTVVSADGSIKTSKTYISALER
jgi:hypothetical protein